MNARSLVMGLVLLALPAHATTVGQTTLGKLVSGAHVIVVGEVSRVIDVPAGDASIEPVRVAEVEVLEWIKGKPRPKLVWYLAEGTHGADWSDAVVGETSLLFLFDPLVLDRAADEDVRDRLAAPAFRKHLAELTGGAPLLHICWSGYGRMPLDVVEGVRHATIVTFTVRTSPEMTSIPGATPLLCEFERRVPLDSLLEFAKRRLAPCGGPARIQRLLDELDASTDPWPSERAQAMIEEQGEEAVPALLSLLADPAFARRDTVAEALFWIGDAAWEKLREALRSKDVPRRRAAAFALAWAASTEFVDAEEVTPEAVTAASGEEPDVEVRARVIAALARGGGADENEPVDAALAALRDESLRVRRSAARTLFELRSLHGEDFPLGRVETALLDLANVEDVDFRREVWEDLAWVAGPRTLPAALRALDDTDRVVRVMAVFSLRRIRDPVATKRLLLALASEDEWARRCAAYALGVLRTVEAVGPLTKALGDPDVGVVRCATDALGEMGPAGAAAVPALEQLYETTKDPYLRSDVEDALAKIRE